VVCLYISWNDTWFHGHHFGCKYVIYHPCSPIVLSDGGCSFLYVVNNANRAAYSWIHTYLRLLNPLRAVDVPYYGQAVIAALLFGGMFTLLGFVGELVTYPHSPVSAFFYSFFQYFCCAGICLSMLCLFVDARTSAAVVQDLLSLAKMEALTVDKLRSARSQIDEIVDKSLLPNAILASAAAINAVAFILIVLLLRTLTENTLHQPLLDAERYQLAQKGFLVGLTLNYVDKDNERMKCYVNYTGKPIAFKLLSIRPTKFMVFSHVGGYVISLVVAFVQQACKMDGEYCLPYLQVWLFFSPLE
jgi:hypothetical protein